MNASAWLSAGLGLSCFLAELPASAAISAQIPAECGSLSEFEQELEQRLGNLNTKEGTRVTLTPEVSGYRLVVEAGNQSRELHDASCQELLRAAVVIALALLEPKREEPATPALAPAPEQPVQPPAPLATPAERHTHPKAALGVAAGLHVGTLPEPTLLLEFDTELKWKRFGAAAGLRYLLPRSRVDESGHGLQLGAVGAHLAGLFEPWHWLQMRVGVATYRLSARGLGSTERGEGTAWEVAPTLGASFVPFAHPPFWTRLGLEGQLNLIRPSFEILSYREVFQVPPLSGSALASMGVVF